MAHSSHLNDKKLTQREGAIPQYDLEAVHAERIETTAKCLFDRAASYLPTYAEVLKELQPKQFAERLHALVKGSSEKYLEEEKALVEQTPNAWNLHYTKEDGLQLISLATDNFAVRQFLSSQILPKGVRRPSCGDLVIPVRGKWYGYNENLPHLMCNNSNDSGKPGLLEAMTDKTQLTLPQALLRHPLKTEEELEAIYQAARAGAPIIQEAQRLEVNHKAAQRALDALLKPQT